MKKETSQTLSIIGAVFIFCLACFFIAEILLGEDVPARLDRPAADTSSVYLCDSAATPDVQIIDKMHCAIDSCFHEYFDLQGNKIDSLDDYGVNAGARKKPSDYARNCRKAASFNQLVHPIAASVGGQPLRAKKGSAVVFGDIEVFNLKQKMVTLRLVEWVQGEDNKEQAALETGQCELWQIESDQCLPNNFIIRKTEKDLTLSLSDDMKIKIYARNGESGMISGPDGGIYQTFIDRETFNRYVTTDASFKMIPFVFTTTNGVVTQIEEQYVP